MSGQGPVGGVNAGATTRPQTAGTPAGETHCFDPGRSQANAGVRGGGPATPAHSASLLHTRPDCMPAGVTRGGAPHVDPTVAALANLLSAATPTYAPKDSSMRQLAQLLNAGFDRLAQLAGSIRERIAPASAAVPVEVAEPPQQQIRPGIAPSYMVDLQTGRLISNLPHDAAAGAHRDIGPVSAWPPVPGAVRDASGSSPFVERMDGWLAELGITRWQLVLLTIVAPLATAIAIDLVSRAVG